MTPTSLAAAVAPRTGKIIKNGLRVFEKGENLLHNGILHFAFNLSQSSEIVSYQISFKTEHLFKKSKNRISGLSFIHKARRHVIFQSHIGT